jgi:hypothetical protein
MEGQMNGPAILKEFEKESLFAVPDLAGKIFAKAKSLAEEKGVPPTSQLRTATHTVLRDNLGEDLANRVIHSEEHGKLISAANSLIANERRLGQNKDTQYAISNFNTQNKSPVPKVSPQQSERPVVQENLQQGRNFVLRPRKAGLGEAEKARHEPPTLVQQADGTWVREDQI